MEKPKNTNPKPGYYNYGNSKNKYQKIGNQWYISNDVTDFKFQPIHDPTGNRAKELNKNAKVDPHPWIQNPKTIEGKLNARMGDPQGQSARAAAFYAKPEEDDLDNLRHGEGARRTQQAIAKATGSNLLGYFGSVGLGVGHELGTMFTDPRPWGVVTQEAYEDIKNNNLGATMGYNNTPNATKRLNYLSQTYQMPDGYGAVRPFPGSNWTDPYDKIEREKAQQEVWNNPNPKPVGLTEKFADGGPLHDRDINGKLLQSTYASSLGNMFREGGPFGEDKGTFDYANSIYASQPGNYYNNGGPITKLNSTEEKAFQNFYSTLPENLQTDDSTYDIRGYWDGLGRPLEFDYSQPKESDGYYQGFSINPNTGEYLKSPAHETFQHAVDEDRKIGYRPVTNVYGRNIATYNPSIIEPTPTTFLTNTAGPINYRTGGQFPRPYSLPEDSFKQGGTNLHNSVYASSSAPYPGIYANGGPIIPAIATYNPTLSSTYAKDYTARLKDIKSNPIDPKTGAPYQGSGGTDAGSTGTGGNYRALNPQEKAAKIAELESLNINQLRPELLEQYLSLKNNKPYFVAAERSDKMLFEPFDLRKYVPMNAAQLAIAYPEPEPPKPTIGYATDPYTGKIVPGVSNVQNGATFQVNRQMSQFAEAAYNTPEASAKRAAIDSERLNNIELLKTMTPEQKAAMRAAGLTPAQYLADPFSAGATEFAEGGSILSMSNTPQLEGEGKDLTYPDGAYVYGRGGVIKTSQLFAGGGPIYPTTQQLAQFLNPEFQKIVQGREITVRPSSAQLLLSDANKRAEVANKNKKFTYVDPVSNQKIEYDSKQDFINKQKRNLSTGKTVINKGDEIVPALGTALEFTGVPAGLRTLDRLKEDPLTLAKNIGTTAVDLATLPQNLAYEGANYLFGNNKFNLPIDTEALSVTGDALSLLPAANLVGKFAGNMTRRAIYNAIDPVAYGMKQKILSSPKTFINNVFNPSTRPTRIGEQLVGTSSNYGTDQIAQMGMNRLDAWRLGLKMPQKYNTFEQIADNTYRIKNMKPERGRFSVIDKDTKAYEIINSDKYSWEEKNDLLKQLFEEHDKIANPPTYDLSDINNLKRYLRKSGDLQTPLYQQSRIVEKALQPEFKYSVYDVDPQGIMGSYRWDVRKDPTGALHYQSNDIWDINPWENRGAVRMQESQEAKEILKKHFFKPLQNIEALRLVGGKPFKIQNNFAVDPVNFKVITKWEQGGQMQNASYSTMKKNRGVVETNQEQFKMGGQARVIKSSQLFNR